MNAILLLGVFFLFVLLRVPVAMALALASFFGVLVLEICPLTMVGSAAFNTLYSYTILAIPFYIFAGIAMTRGGISKKLCDLAGTIFSKYTGGLGMVSVVASAFFAAISGSSTATTAAIGSMMVPEMEKKGYRKSYGLAICAAGGVIGPIIPPSISFVLYGVATETSIGDLFIAGLMPGIFLAACLCVAVYFTARKADLHGDDTKFSIKNFLRAGWSAKWAILVPVIILGGIYGGVFTPTEAGAVACIYTIVVTMFIERTLDFKGLLNCARESAVTSATILLLVGTAGIFGRVLTLAEVPQMLSNGIMAIASNKVEMLLLVNLLLLVVGCVMEGAAAIIILAPLLLPVAQAYGVDPIHFGMIMCVNIGIGAITPPVGACLFAASVIGETPFEKICKEIVPFLLAELVCLFAVVVFEPLSTGLLALLH